MRKLMPGPPMMNRKTAEGEDEATRDGQRVWVLRNQQPAPVPVKTGLTNGKLTEILSGGIAAGVPLVVEAVKVEK